MSRWETEEGQGGGQEGGGGWEGGQSGDDSDAGSGDVDPGGTGADEHRRRPGVQPDRLALLAKP